MPGAVTGPAIVGFYGKVPARGDFVRAGLPRDFTDPWDVWLEAVIAVTRAEAGDAWLPAYLEAPIWRFTLPAGLCGKNPVLGLTMPSVDKAGRYFPLTFAAVSPQPDLDHRADDAWLNACEDAGRTALESDTPPEAILADIPRPALLRAPVPSRNSNWWTSGSVRLPATQFSLKALPNSRVFARMLGIGADTTVPVDAP